MCPPGTSIKYLVADPSFDREYDAAFKRLFAATNLEEMKAIGKEIRELDRDKRNWM